MKRIVVSGAVLALAVGSMGVSQAQSGFKVTGGGQALTQAGADNGVRGPGDTYGFNAQDLDGNPMTDAAKGQFNSIQRNGGDPTGKGKGEHIRGEVNCLIALTGGEDGAARFGGTVRGQEGAADPLLFAVDVTDNGEGNAANDDIIVFRTFRQSTLQNQNDNACDQEPERPTQDSEVVLARGNVQIHNNPGA